VTGEPRRESREPGSFVSSCYVESEYPHDFVPAALARAASLPAAS
jgi:hypothetical protein